LRCALSPQLVLATVTMLRQSIAAQYLSAFYDGVPQPAGVLVLGRGGATDTTNATAISRRLPLPSTATVRLGIAHDAGHR
jgi:hypothetical protein